MEFSAVGKHFTTFPFFIVKAYEIGQLTKEWLSQLICEWIR